MGTRFVALLNFEDLYFKPFHENERVFYLYNFLCKIKKAQSGIDRAFFRIKTRINP